MRAVAKHSPELAQSVVDCGALEALVICLEEFDPGVKEAAAWALGYVARHNGGMQLNTVEYQRIKISPLTISLPLPPSSTIPLMKSAYKFLHNIIIP